MKLLYAVLLMVGMATPALGQVHVDTGNAVGGGNTFVAVGCYDTVTFHGSSKLIREIFPKACEIKVMSDGVHSLLELEPSIKDIFPEECAAKLESRIWDELDSECSSVEGKPIACPRIVHSSEEYLRTVCRDLAKPKECANLIARHNPPLTFTEAYYLIYPDQKPEPIDVPAVKKTRPASHPCNLPGSSNTTCITGDEEYWICDSLNRILLTSEDGTKWCHKPQSE